MNEETNLWNYNKSKTVYCIICNFSINLGRRQVGMTLMNWATHVLQE